MNTSHPIRISRKMGGGAYRLVPAPELGAVRYFPQGASSESAVGGAPVRSREMLELVISLGYPLFRW